MAEKKHPHLWLLKAAPEVSAALAKLPRGTRAGVFRQLDLLLYADDPYLQPFVEMLKDPRFQRARKFRVGDYRVLFVVRREAVEHQKTSYRGTLYVLLIENRRDVYTNPS